MFAASVPGSTDTVSAAGAVPFASDTFIHAGAVVESCLASTSALKFTGVRLADVMVTICGAGGSPPASPPNVRLVVDTCTDGTIAIRTWNF